MPRKDLASNDVGPSRLFSHLNDGLARHIVLNPQQVHVAKRSYSAFFFTFLSRTPGPPPSSSMNSTPAFSSAARTLASVFCAMCQRDYAAAEHYAVQNGCVLHQAGEAGEGLFPSARVDLFTLSWRDGVPVVCSRTNLKVTLGSVVLGRSNSFKST
jgi:hypothetical protein